MGIVVQKVSISGCCIKTKKLLQKVANRKGIAIVFSKRPVRTSLYNLWENAENVIFLDNFVFAGHFALPPDTLPCLSCFATNKNNQNF